MKLNILQSIRTFINAYRWYRRYGHCHKIAWHWAKNTIYH